MRDITEIHLALQNICDKKLIEMQIESIGFDGSKTDFVESNADFDAMLSGIPWISEWNWTKHDECKHKHKYNQTKKNALEFAWADTIQYRTNICMRCY